MNEQNHSEIGTAMNFVLRPMLAAFVQKNLAQHFGADNWWRRGVLDVLYDDQKKFLPTAGEYGTLLDALDVQLCLLLIDIHWREIFSARLPRNYLNYVKELKTTRNLWAHDADAFDDAATIRALDTMARISEQFDSETAQRLRAMWSARLQPDKPVAAQVQEKFSPPPLGRLRPWRDVIEPHPDVARGEYRQAEFALNLAEILRNKGRVEYTDPAEFFARTFLTGGLKKLLVEVLKRLSGGNGEPVVQLKTPFGGGKSHSLLALYHLFGGIRPEQSAAVREILQSAGLTELPQVHTAVIVGTWENPLSSTLWGELAKRLARTTGKPELYEMMRANDEQKISPGVGLLEELFNAAGACLVLIDEVVAYGRKLRLNEVDGGTFENLLTFIQELTEAAQHTRTAVVVSIPESEDEIGGELGRRVLAQVEKYFGRVEMVWTPVTVTESYEIVRRRLFKPCNDLQARDEVCAAYFNMYVANEHDFPHDSRQKNYREQLTACYPIHPKLFDYLYGKWSSLENFQRTRGVLRLMSQVIYRLWSSNDRSLLIMPGSIPLDAEEVHAELTKLLGDNWSVIVNAEIDGVRSKAYELDGQNVRFGRLSAARKIARTIFMGTAPDSRKGGLRGIGEDEIRLGVIQPQESADIAVFNDALSKLKSNLYYLYSQGAQLWFNVNPTLRKYVDDRRGQFSDDDLDFEIEQRLAKWKELGAFKKVYICPKTSADVDDLQTARLVILPPQIAFNGAKSATETAKNFLDNRGTVPRHWKNMLLFIAADAEKLRILKNHVRDFLAWQAVLDDVRHLNLDVLQLDDARGNLKLTAENVAMKLSQAYGVLIAPEQARDADLNLPLSVTMIDCTTGKNISVASEKFVRDLKLIDVLGGDMLRRLMDQFIWREVDCVSVGELWRCFGEYYYMPRLVEKSVMLDAVSKGVAAKKFALADSRDGEKFIGLRFGDVAVRNISDENFLVKAEVAEAQLNLPTPPVEPPVKPPVKPPVEPPPLPKKFSMNAELDNTRYGKDIKRCVEEIASLLMTLPAAEMSIRLTIDVTVPDGVDSEMQGIVADNCRGQNITNFRFE